MLLLTHMSIELYNIYILVFENHLYWRITHLRVYMYYVYICMDNIAIDLGKSRPEEIF